ncbi:MAG: ATPase [Pseudomonas sp.]|uniref:ATPase n=1 Tax=Pseudomonas sp. TaxID=306 RepID=UPI0033921A25
MRNDALDELDSVPSLTTDSRDREDFGRAEAPERGHGPARGAAPVVVKSSSTGALWALVGALVITLGGLGWWSYQQISLMEAQLVATQESFARISEEAAGRIKDISGKVVATESSVTNDTEALKLKVKQLDGKLTELLKQQQKSSGEQSGQAKQVDQLVAGLNAQQTAAAQLVTQLSQLEGQLKGLLAEQAALKASFAGVAALPAQLKEVSAAVESLKKQGNPGVAIARLEQDLLVLRSELENRPAAGNTAEFDAFRLQMTRNVSTLQTQVQNLQQQLNAR